MYMYNGDIFHTTQSSPQKSFLRLGLEELLRVVKDLMKPNRVLNLGRVLSGVDSAAAPKPLSP